MHEESITQIKQTSFPYQLHSEDRNSMMHSVESRLPFLDFDLTDFIMSMPVDFKIRNGKTKVIFREAMKNIIPDLIYNRHIKIGFKSPDEILFKTKNSLLKNKIEEALFYTDEILDTQIITLFNNFRIGKEKYHPILFRALSFCIWAREFNIKKE